MTNTAFRFDLSQKDPIIHFAKQVGSLERLQMLMVLSCADLDAVGPGALNEWKLNLILQLYDATEAQFRSDSPGQRFLDIVATQRAAVMAHLTATEREDPWWTEQIDGIPSGYLISIKPNELIRELRRLHQLTTDKPVQAWGKFIGSQDAIEYVTAVLQQQSSGLFHRIAGALTSQGLSILSAEIHTQPGRIAWDRFVVQDPDYEGTPPPERIEQIASLFEGQHLKATEIGENPELAAKTKILILDLYGMLSKAYRFGTLSYVGGGFNRGIHNVLEAAVYGKPVVFGPKHARFAEAERLIEAGGAISIDSAEDFMEWLIDLAEHDDSLIKMGHQASMHIHLHTGGTQRVLLEISKILAIT
jgi:hypothetical protein